ncbi:glycosyltransferase [Mesorhizobium sp. NBSH29]|uniref:glycosyltransferase n=1 Tax=Mesorhizobium sp. NBSH29 TaxID=2654249 RepID=UPI0018C120A9|nr:glycosyltransferase [Mesorhizobium sp. NBSH29]
MLTVLIETINDEEGLARTLASLVSGAVEGMIREVIVCDTGSKDQTRRVAEQAGCHVEVGISIFSCVARSKGDWLLILEPGARLIEGWVDEVVQHVAKSEMPARFSRSRRERAGFLTRVLSPVRPLAQGLLISKKSASTLASSASRMDAIGRGLATRLLAAEIIPARLRN